MLVVTGLNDKVPIIPNTWLDWREIVEYVASIALAFGTGDIVGLLIFDVFPRTVSHDGKPNAVAFVIAGCWEGMSVKSRCADGHGEFRIYCARQVLSSAFL
jgi:hypothetical protein